MLEGLLQLDDPCRLLLANGNTVVFPYRHVAELVAHLACNGDSDRASLASKLWPNAPTAERQANLRQALKHARQLLGADNIISGRKTCSLSSGVSIRVEHKELAIYQVSESTKLKSALPEIELEDLMRKGSLRLAADPKTLRGALNTWKRTRTSDVPTLAWRHYCEGYSNLAVEAKLAVVPLKEAARLAALSGQWELYSSAVFWLGIVGILVGDLEFSERISVKARSRLLVHDRRYANRMDNILAHVKLHRGQTHEAVNLLESLELSDCVDPEERGLLTALKAVYLAYDENYVASERALGEIVGGPANKGTKPYYQLAEIILDTASLTSNSLSNAECLAQGFQESGQLQLEMYTRELIVSRDRQRGRGLVGESQLSRIRSLQSQLGIVRSAWDKKRLLLGQ